MKRFQIVLGQSVRCYAAVVVEAETPEEAARLAFAQRYDLTYEPDWDIITEEPDIACDPDECELVEA